jgi:uncharacterized protein YlaI
MQERIEELRSMPYDQYLKTPEWRAKREEALERDGYRCRLCDSDERLHVHHRTYARRGNEDIEDLTTLCEECHERFHEKTVQTEQKYQRKEFIERVRKLTKESNINATNRLLLYGWRIIAIEQYTAMDGYKETSTYFILGHVNQDACD